MIAVEVNYLAVVVCALASMILGMLWYSVLFGDAWSRMTFGKSMKEMKKGSKDGMTRSMILGLIGALVGAYVMAHFVQYLGAIDATGAFQAASWIWLGFIATAMVGMVLWEGKPWKLYFINAGYQLVNLNLIALILVLWP